MKRLGMKIGIWLLPVILFGSAISLQRVVAHADRVEPPVHYTKQLAIVIDDFGNKMAGTQEMLDLPIPLTIAVMPFLPSTQKDAQMAHEKGHEVFLHLPMEPKQGRKSWLGPGAITTDLSNEEIRKRVEAAIDNVPYAVGINNHMGSKATGDERVMRAVLEVCKERHLIFLDSHTNYRSVAGKIARQMGVSTTDNQLFLDDQHTARHISKQIELIKKRLIEHDQCIAIGHVGTYGKKTAEVLKISIPALRDKVDFVPISRIISHGM